MQQLHSVVHELKSSPCVRARAERMNRRISRCRRRASFEAPSAHTLRDRLSRRQEVELAQDSFGRYFALKKDNPFDVSLFLEALADFGIKGRTRQEKFGLREMIDMYPKSTINFGDFCTLVEDAKAKMRQLHSWATHRAWRLVDRDDRHALPPAGVIQVMADLGFIAPNDSSAKSWAETLIGELTLDEQGLVSFDEAEYAIEDMRYREESMQRRRERDIQRGFGLSDKLFKEFRTDLQSHLQHFNQLDEDSSGSLDAQEILNLLDDFGFVSKSKRAKTLQVVGRITAQNSGVIRFPVYLEVVKELRAIDMESKREEVVHLFMSHDRDRSGELDMRETCAVLMSLGLQPRTVKEQQSMAELLEEARPRWVWKAQS